MIKCISILDFLKTGRFGQLTSDINVDDVITILGLPDNRIDTPDVTMFSYGRWEIHFLCSNSSKIFFIQNDSLLYDCLNHDEMIEYKNDYFIIDLDFIKPFEYVRLNELILLFKNNSIAYTVEDDFQLNLTSGVYLTFTDTKPEIPQQDGFHWKQNIQNSIIAETEKNPENLLLASISIRYT